MSAHRTVKFPKLSDLLSLEDIDKLRERFQKLKSGGLSYENFRLLVSHFNVIYSDDAFHNVCLRIDLDRDNVINWSEFIAYFILELHNDDNAKERLSIIPPIPKPANVLSTAQRSKIVRVLFTNSNLASANYVTVGCFGDLNVWTSEWMLKTCRRIDEIPSTTSSKIELSDKLQIQANPKTLILDAAIFANLGIICISSVSCDLRFYDIASVAKYNLRLYIRNFPSPLSSLFYHSATDDGEESKLIFGDMLGSVRVICFTRGFRVHFREGSMMRQISYRELIKGSFATMACREFIKIHHDIVRQVSFVKSMNSFISAAESVITKSAHLPRSVIIGDLDSQESQIVFTMNSGTSCFAFDETSKTLATGGLDCLLRLWSPISPNRPRTILSGHTSGIVHIFMQDDDAKTFSLDKHKNIKVWDVHKEQLLQTFTGFKSIFTDDVPIIAFYNDWLREFVVATKNIATIKCQPKIDLNETDGFTDMSAITVILLNELFLFLVTCSEASTIIIWDVCKGHKVNLITRAHTRVEHGLVLLNAITAGCFDPKHQFLLTAGDTTLKVWNFNEGLCLRTITIGSCHRIKDVFWTRKRILAVSKGISEAHDSSDYRGLANQSTAWERCHLGDIICASFREPEAIVTCCTDGDLVFWNFETGRPYSRFNVKNPSDRLVIVVYDEMTPEERQATKAKRNKTFKESWSSSNISTSITQCMLSLNHRPVDASNGTLFVSLSSGRIQVWSHHHAADRYITDFNAIHVAGDVITVMASDTQNCYLFTGSAKGFIKTWMIVNFCLSTSVDEKISPVKLRKLFPLLSRDDIEGRAKESVKNQLEPQLLNSFQGHLKSITGLIYHEQNQLLISSSRDRSVRLWNLTGQYIGTIGSPINWRSLSPNEAPPHDYAYRIPADLKHAVSFTTMKVLEGGNIPSLHSRHMKELEALETGDMKDTETLEAAQPLHFHRKPVVRATDTQRRYEKPTLDISLPHIPVYSHLRIHPTVHLNLPQTIPKCLETKNLPNLRYHFLEPNELRTEK